MENQSKTLIQRAIEKIEAAKVSSLQQDVQSSFEKVEHSLWAAVSSDLWFFKEGLIKVSDQLHSDIVSEQDTIKSSYSFNNQGMKAVLKGAAIFESIGEDVKDYNKSAAFILDVLMETVDKKMKNVFEGSEDRFQYALSLYIMASIYKNILIALQEAQNKPFNVEDHFKEAEEKSNERNGNYEVMAFLENNLSSLILKTEQMQNILRVEKLKKIAELAVSAIVEVVFQSEVVGSLKEISDIIAKLGLSSNALSISESKGVYFQIKI